METFKEKRERKLERYKHLAASKREASESAYQDFRKHLQVIPLGQPILVGHHSEKRHRAHIKKTDRLLEKSVNELRASEHYQSRVDAMENSKLILSDDPDAIEKLEDRIKMRENLLLAYKKLIKDFKALGKEKAIELTELNKDKARSMFSTSYKGEEYLPSFYVTNLRARLRNDKKKLELQSKMNIETPSGFDFSGGSVKFENMYWLVFFDEKPSEEIRTKLKTYPISLKWSPRNTAWIRKQTPNVGSYFVNELKKVLGA